MKAVAILSLISLAVASVVEKRQCAGNNCNRAITGTRDGLPVPSVRSADCAKFQTTTVTPPAVTVTVTVDAEDVPAVTPRGVNPLEYRQASAAPVKPTYATQCADNAAYAQACACYGITSGVATAPAATTTVTSTIDYCEDL